jgi:hypothetical protein
MVQVQGVTLTELKNSLFDLCNTHKDGCGRLLKEANKHGQVSFRGYIASGGIFGKTLIPLITMESSYTEFKKMALVKKGKEIGFRITMENPKKIPRTTSKASKATKVSSS